MQKAKTILLVGLIVPILALSCLCLSKYYLINYGREVILPISGYDPRSLLYGNYLIYTIDYGVPDICKANPDIKNINFRSLLNIQDAYVCLDPKEFSYSEPKNCALLIKGNCNYNRFVAGIERFYASEASAKKLDHLVRDDNLSIALALDGRGNALVKYLLVNNERWKPS